MFAAVERKLEMVQNSESAPRRRQSDDNKELVHQFWGCLGSGDFAKMASLYHEDVAYHGSGGEELRGRAAAVDFARGYKAGFPDIQAEIEQLVAEGDLVVSRVRVYGTNTGELMGMPPTGRAVDLRWVMNMVRIVDGQIAEEWEVFDQADFARQLGLDA
jgi:steroid delta-isomerase-like uncharacterized protein